MQRRQQQRQKQQQRLNSSVRYRSVVVPPPPLPSSYPSATTTAASATPKKQLAKRRLRLPPSYASGISLARRYPQKHQQQHRRQSSSLNYAAQAAYKASLDAFKRGTYSKNAETVSAIRTSPGAKCLVFLMGLNLVSVKPTFEAAAPPAGTSQVRTFALV